MSITFTHRARIGLLTLLTAVLGLAGIVAPSAAQAAIISYGASPAHPYSDPTWWPASTETTMGCYRGNSGCGGDHSTYIWDIVAKKGIYTSPVFAMGAGIVHIGATHTGCGHAQSRGDYLYIDHGNGVLTYYGHLGRILVRSGQYVSPRTTLAYMGNSGYAGCHAHPWLRYVMVAKKIGGEAHGRYVEITHTLACPSNGGARVTWPQQLPRGRASHWNAVHNETPIPATSSSRSCIPVPTRTASRPTVTAAARHGQSTVYAAWTRSSSSFHVSSTVVTLSMYHPSIHRWLAYSHQWLSGATTVTRFHHLHHKRHYAVTVQVRNAWGYSAPFTRYTYIGK
ncbi:M23 family metallopeptidase [uncultured Jatrophihabitans sp.]|uniref:M23 family metallopeptidase n=1 Tax=uncultured Jatrophihabitans sp. TaxID=1610747 RepID=UPI0035CB0917